MKDNKHKIILFCIGFIVIMAAWLIINAEKLSLLRLLWTVLLITLSYLVAVFDINKKQIPNELIIIMITIWLILIVPLIIYDMDSGISVLTDSLLGVLIGGGIFMLVYIVSRKGLGGGDVKFMAAAGLYLGFTGTIPAILYGTVLAAITGLVLLICKKIGRKDTIPLAPFLFVGILITVFSN